MKKQEGQCSRLKNFSISFLAITLGLAGFALAFQKMTGEFNFNSNLSLIILYVSLVVVALIFGIYIIKLIRYPNEVKKELNHPIKLNFFPIVAKVSLIVSIIFLNLNLVFSKYAWYFGVLVQLIFTLVIMSVWIRHKKFKMDHINPSWFIPIVGSLIIPIAGIVHATAELSWFFFSIGLIWWLVLFVIVINRMIFHNPIQDKLIPTLFILFAPPAIGFISYVKLVGEITPFAKILYYFALFMFILIMCQIKLFTKIKFYLSWWAYSFPIVALNVATIFMYTLTGLIFFKVFAFLLFGLLNLVVLMLIFRTVKAIRNRELCVEEEE